MFGEKNAFFWAKARGSKAAAGGIIGDQIKAMFSTASTNDAARLLADRGVRARTFEHSSAATSARTPGGRGRATPAEEEETCCVKCRRRSVQAAGDGPAWFAKGAAKDVRTPIRRAPSRIGGARAEEEVGVAYLAKPAETEESTGLGPSATVAKWPRLHGDRGGRIKGLLTWPPLFRRARSAA